jgi:hypothetical protein
MRYSIRRIGIGSTLRVSLMLGWLVALCPAICLAGLAVQLLRSIRRALAQVEPFDINVLGQTVATIDPIGLLKLSGAAEAVGRLTASLPITFGALALLLTIVGAAVFLVVGLLFALGYNLLAPATGGLEVELRNAEPDTATRTIGAQQS